MEVAGASPETLVKLENGILHTFPLAGTRPRGRNDLGEIREEYDALDAIEAVLPAGTLSGAPKIRACQLIGELENNKRDIYGGAIGYINFTGNMDTCIAIRIAYKKNGKVFVTDPDTLPDCLKITAKKADGEIMAVQHMEYPVYGVQFHPETIMTLEGKHMLSNFISSYQKS